MIMKDNLGDRIKHNYEDVYRIYLPKKIPCIIRLDGRAFHTFTKKYEKPFSEELHNQFINAAQKLLEECSGSKAAYIQSDECSILLTDYDKNETNAWFDYNKSKIETIAASIFTIHFNLAHRTTATFDARSFSVPREDVSNYFLWRVKDCVRNSISSYCQEFYSSKQLENKSTNDRLNLLSSIGKNWEDLPNHFKYGTWLTKIKDNYMRTHITTNSSLSNFDSVNNILESYL